MGFVLRWEDGVMPRAYPQGFREKVVRIARLSELTYSQIAKDLGISDTRVSNWVRRADVEDGKAPGTSAAEAGELREVRKRIWILEQENEICAGQRSTWGVARSQNDVSPGGRAGRSGDTGCPVVPGVGILQASVYAWKYETVSWRDRDDAHLVNAARDVHADNSAFGYRLIHDELALIHGHKASRNRVARLCREN